MRRRYKGLLVILLVALIGVSSFLYVLNGILNPPPPEPLNLDDAPAEIRAMKADLKDKLSRGDFTWDDMENFSVFSEYVAAHQPEAIEITTGWEITAVLDIIDTGYLWFVVENDTLDLEAKLVAPVETDVTIALSFDTLIEVFSCQTTAASAFQRGEVDFDGTLGIALKIDRLNTIFSYTIMDAAIYYSSGIIEFRMTHQEEGSYTSGLTLFPCMEIIIANESAQIGSMGSGKVLIVNDKGEVVNQLNDAMHSVHKFMNSTTVMMGGSDGWMELWNIETDTRVTLPVPAGHHELDYNPATDTFMVLETATSGEIWDGLEVIYDTISEYNWDGDLLWQWDARVHYPFNSTVHTWLGHNYTFRGYADWMHANSFSWDKEENTIWLNVRNQDTLLKIDKDTGEIIWKAGRWGNFTVLTLNGTEVDTVFNYPHSLEWVGEDHYMLFDNGLFNPDVPTSMTQNGTGISGFIEIELDEENQILREIWSWYAMNETYYFSESGGDADRLPDGNTLGIFGNMALVQARPVPVIFTEVSPEGEIVWELQICGGEGTYYWAHRLERFYEEPVVHINQQNLNVNQHTLFLNLSVYNCVKQMHTSTGEVRILVNGEEVYQDSLVFQPQWLVAEKLISITTLPDGVRYIILQVENSDGIVASVLLYGQLPGSSNVLNPLFLSLAGIIVAIPVALVILIKTGKLRRNV